MSENRGPLVPHPDRPNVWVRDEGWEPEHAEISDDLLNIGAVRYVDLPEPSPGFWELVLTWVGIFLSGWLSFLVAHAAMQVALAAVGLQRSAALAASLGAIVGAVAWLVGRRR